MNDEHVLQVLHGPLHPVVEGCRPLGVLQVQLVNGLQLLLCPLWGERLGSGTCWEHYNLTGIEHETEVG